MSWNDSVSAHLLGLRQFQSINQKTIPTELVELTGCCTLRDQYEEDAISRTEHL